MDELTALTRDLVSIPSHDGEAEVGDFIESWLREHTDATVTRDDAGEHDETDSEPRGGNVIARKGSGERSLALVGHHDVVPPDESQVDASGDYVVYQEDGRLYGRGSADMKGAVAAAMLAFRDADPDCELVFASFVGEEVGGVGARYAIEQGFAPDHALVAEGSTGYDSPEGIVDVALAHKGRRGSTVTARGSAAHASEPHLGENAIYRGCEAVERIKNLDWPTTEAAGETLEGSVVVTEIDGGSAWNVVPETCEITVDERTVPGERAALESVEELEDVEWTVVQDLPPMRCDDDEFADAVLEAVREVQSGQGQHVTKPHATDAGWLAQAGTECIVCGPSEPGEAHTRDESVSLAVLETCYEAYLELAERWC
ncbi:M20 family metallopeptidase [Haloarchaeobius sp. HME9146]|uniref:M20 family metallopeptidase n=1 Tax=Haloarchaeobius sp. HME9146 TaxID=2978732 RepID=UPI0021C028A7|nr:M20/M25/M40 family metallo-hydrolase [Haloarchaeobius sp. HME9146]MCT9095407.1 M20/M25/M40 family metallo-hydrolase [Haloarchaeobius sp. HME9146]